MSEEEIAARETEEETGVSEAAEEEWEEVEITGEALNVEQLELMLKVAELLKKAVSVPGFEAIEAEISSATKRYMRKIRKKVKKSKSKRRR
jgi:8-oxo-dGTP pyrophosphatase MutT (NUDIX family)